MNIDIITQYCIYNDYPIWRRNMQKYRDRVRKIILYPSRHHGVIDLESFAKEAFPETWVEPVPIDYGVEDWRQAETDPCLKHSDAEWIWFTEQDFFVKNWDKFYDDIEKGMKTHDMIGWWNPTHFPYMHPCCLFMKRDLFEATTKDFKAHPEIPGCDHFAMLTRQAETLNAKILTLQDLGYKNWDDAFHLGGLTYPYQNWKGDGTDHFGVGNVEAFYVYNYWSRYTPVMQTLEYANLSVEIEMALRDRFPEVRPAENKWAKYFI